MIARIQKPKPNLKLFIFALGLFLMLPLNLQASYEAYHPKVTTDNPFKVFGRGVTNFSLVPLEIGTTLVRETQMHSRLWPATYIPRLASNLIFRWASAGNDMFLLPWIAPFTDDTSPWTAGIGLPKYPWQVE